MMKIYQKIFLIHFFIFLMSSSSLLAQLTMEIKTEFPAPFGAYEQIRLTPFSPRPPTCEVGQLMVEDGTFKIWRCGNAGTWIDTGAGIWESRDDGSWLSIFPKDTLTKPNLKIGIGTYDPTMVGLYLDQDGSILAEGTFNSAFPTTLPATTPATWFIWYPKRAAIRAGQLTSGYESRWNDINIGSYSVAFGLNTIAVSYASSVHGGELNAAWTNNYNVVGGGKSNTASGGYSSIHGGYSNEALSNYSVIGGGYDHQIWSDSEYSAIAGGKGSNINGNSDYSFIGGGYLHFMSPASSYATIIGGYRIWLNTSNYGTIGGGYQNVIQYAPNGFIGGGMNNVVQSTSGVPHPAMTIGGGGGNIVYEDYGIIGGGNVNYLGVPGTPNTGRYGTIVGGRFNKIYSNYSAIGGGDGNIAGDSSDILNSSHAFVGGGLNNQAKGQYSAVGGGRFNQANGDYSFVGGGHNNQANGNYAMIEGGQDNRADGDYSYAGGRNMQISADGDYSFAWGYSATAQTIGTPRAFVIYNDFSITRERVGIGTTVPAHKLHVEGNVQIDVGPLVLASPPDIIGGYRLSVPGPGGGVISRFDLSEIFETSEEVEVGDLLVIDKKKDQITLKKSQGPYDPKVIGVASGAPAVVMDEDQLVFSPKPYEFTKGMTPPVALSGRVLCKVSLENGPIDRGDLLTSSSIAGHAMKAADPDKAFGTVIARALEKFTGGEKGETEGMIEVFVTRR